MNYIRFMQEFRDYRCFISRIEYMLQQNNDILKSVDYKELQQVIKEVIKEQKEDKLIKYIEEKKDNDDIGEWNIRQLRAEARALNIRHWSRLSKYDLITAIYAIRSS